MGKMAFWGKEYTMKKIISIISALLILSMLFIACDDVTDPVTDGRDTSESESVSDTVDAGDDTGPDSESQPIEDDEPEEGAILGLADSDVVVDGIIDINEYDMTSGFLDRNTEVYGEFNVIEKHNDTADMWSCYYFEFDNNYVYVGYAERANYGSEVYFDFNPDAKDKAQLSLHLLFSRKTGEKENATYPIQSYDMMSYSESAPYGEVIDADKFIVESARSWWDDGLRNVNYVELKLDRKALAEYAGVENFSKIGFRGTCVSVPPVGGGNPVSCYGNKESTAKPYTMNEDIGYHLFELRKPADVSSVYDSRFLEEYGQKVLCADKSSSPELDGKVTEGEYSAKLETVLDDYGTLHESKGGKWGVEWANYYVSYDDTCVYIAAELKDSEHIPYGTWSPATIADSLYISLGGMIDSAEPTSIASSLTFILYDGNLGAGDRDIFDIKDTRRDIYGDYVNYSRRLNKADYVVGNFVNHDETTGITTYELAIKLSALGSTWENAGELQTELLTLGARIKDVNADGKTAGERYLGITGTEVDAMYETLSEKHDCTVHYGVIGVEKLIPHMIYLGSENEYTSFKEETLKLESETDTPLGEAPENIQLHVGYSRKSITPGENDFPYFELAGYADGRPISRVRDHLYASCTAFKDAEGDIALIYTLDLHAMHPTQAAEIIARINDATGVPKENIILNVTHSHTAHGFSLDGSGRANYKDKFYNAVISAAKEAIEDLAPCIELYAGEINMAGHSFIRRYITDKGNLYGVAQGGSDTIVAHEHEMDSMIPVARFVRYGAKDVILVNFAAHCDTVSSKAPGAISADYVSSFRRTIEKELDVHFSMQLGATGDVNPVSSLPGEYTFPGTTQYGEDLAHKVIAELDTLPKLEIKGDVEAMKSSVKGIISHETDHMYDKAMEIWNLYYGDRKAEASAKMKEYGILNIYETMYIRARAQAGEYEMRNVSAISIGNIVFGAADYEMFSQTGRDIKDGGNKYFDLTFNCAYSNGMIGYIPAEYAFENGGYEVYSCMYVPGTAENIADEIIRLFGELATN